MIRVCMSRLCVLYVSVVLASVCESLCVSVGRNITERNGELLRELPKKRIS